MGRVLKPVMVLTWTEPVVSRLRPYLELKPPVDPQSLLCLSLPGLDRYLLGRMGSRRRTDGGRWTLYMDRRGGWSTTDL